MWLCVYLIIRYCLYYRIVYITWWRHDFHENYEIGNASGYIWEISSFTSSPTRETRASQLKFEVGNAA